MRHIAYFKANLQSLDAMILWVDSVFAPLSKYRYDKSFLPIYQPKTQRRFDLLGLMLFEYVSNVIEHGILGLEKVQVYNAKRSYRQNILERKKICVCLAFNTRFLTFDIIYPFGRVFRQQAFLVNKQKHNRLLGGKGERIMKWLFMHNIVSIRKHKTMTMRLRLQWH